ncbi:MAG: PHP-associated domain-containing protein [Chloroflexota bacterium]
MLRVETHCHTIYSKDSLTPLAKLLAACQQKNIDRVIITDHNSIQGALRAKALDPERVIVGEEIMTTGGEILAAYVTEEIPQGLAPQEAIDRLRAQGAFISVSHPFDSLRSGGWKLPDLLAILPGVDAIETFNARCVLARFNEQASAFARQHGLLGTAGSDAHIVSELGTATLLLPGFEDAASLKTAISQGKQQNRLSPHWVHGCSTYAKWAKKLKIARGS